MLPEIDLRYLAVDAEALNFQIEQIIAERDEKISEVRAEISKIDEGISDINAANEEKKAGIDAIWKRIYALRDRMDKCIADEQNAAQNVNKAIREQEAAAKGDVSDARAKLGELERKVPRWFRGVPCHKAFPARIYR